MAKSNRRRNTKAAPVAFDLGINPQSRALAFSTESRFLRAEELPRRLRTKPAKNSRSRPE
jgi:hypothetical protein